MSLFLSIWSTTSQKLLQGFFFPNVYFHDSQSQCQYSKQIFYISILLFFAVDNVRNEEYIEINFLRNAVIAPRILLLTLFLYFLYSVIYICCRYSLLLQNIHWFPYLFVVLVFYTRIFYILYENLLFLLRLFSCSNFVESVVVMVIFMRWLASDFYALPELLSGEHQVLTFLLSCTA